MKRFSRSLCVVLLLLAVTVHAHPLNVSYSRFTVRDDAVEGMLRLPTDEMDLVLRIDTDLDGKITLEEMEQARARIEEYLGHHVLLTADGAALDASFGKFSIWNDRDGYPFLETPITYRASKPIESLQAQINVIAEIIPAHKNLSTIRLGARTQEFVFENGATFKALSGGSAWVAVRSFVLLGIEHIFTGYDHILFLFGLLLLASGLKDLVKIVTSFTVAHSITLALATLAIVEPVAWTIEAAIALSIAYIGFENLFVKDIRYRWKITFVFGLIHGFGFANVLRHMELSRSGLAASLLSFNVGVEIGQVAIVGLMYPLLLRLAKTPYRMPITRVASALILAIGLVWFYQRIG